MQTKPRPVEVSQAEREAAAMNDYLAAKHRGQAERARLWARYTDIQNQRPPAVVEEMERRQGLR